jgi:hypothetical protein
MINIQNILDAEIIQEPWPHKIIDNILTEDTFIVICKEAAKLEQLAMYEPRDPNGIWLFKAKELGLSDEIIDLIMELNVKLLSACNDVLQDFPQAMFSKIGYFSIPRFNFIGPNVNGSIHDEGDSKTMALVIYLFPEHSIGTKLYKTQSYDSLTSVIEWKPNRGFLMCSNPNITWHSFHADHQPRMTLNFYYEKFEKIGYVNNLEPQKTDWFWKQYSLSRNAIEF